MEKMEYLVNDIGKLAHYKEKQKMLKTITDLKVNCEIFKTVQKIKGNKIKTYILIPN